MTLEQTLDAIDRSTAWAWIRRTHLPDGVKCPVCGSTITGSRALAAFEALERTYCQAHGGVFRPLSAVAHLRGTEWAPEDYVRLRILHLAKVEPASIGRVLGKSTSCVKNMIDRCAALDALMPPRPHTLAGVSTVRG